jgi:hypothetical protein
VRSGSDRHRFVSRRGSAAGWSPAWFSRPSRAFSSSSASRPPLPEVYRLGRFVAAGATQALLHVQGLPSEAGVVPDGPLHGRFTRQQLGRDVPRSRSITRSPAIVRSWSCSCAGRGSKPVELRQGSGALSRSRAPAASRRLHCWLHSPILIRNTSRWSEALVCPGKAPKVLPRTYTAPLVVDATSATVSNSSEPKRYVPSRAPSLVYLVTKPSSRSDSRFGVPSASALASGHGRGATVRARSRTGAAVHIPVRQGVPPATGRASMAYACGFRQEGKSDGSNRGVHVELPAGVGGAGWKRGAAARPSSQRHARVRFGGVQLGPRRHLPGHLEPVQPSEMASTSSIRSHTRPTGGRRSFKPNPSSACSRPLIAPRPEATPFGSGASGSSTTETPMVRLRTRTRRPRRSHTAERSHAARRFSRHGGIRWPLRGACPPSGSARIRRAVASTPSGSSASR